MEKNHTKTIKLDKFNFIEKIQSPLSVPFPPLDPLLAHPLLLSPISLKLAAQLELHPINQAACIGFSVVVEIKIGAKTMAHEL